MTDEAPSGDIPSPAYLDSVFNASFQKGDDARKRQVWEVAIESYQAALKIKPHDTRTRLGLGRSYEGKSRERDFHVFLTLAMEQYRQALRDDPGLIEAHEALLSSAARLHQLDEILEEYRVRLKKDPENGILKGCVKKIETMLLMDVRPSSEQTPQPHRLTRVVMDWGLPLLGFGCLLGLVICRLHAQAQWSANISIFLQRLGFFCFILYFVYKLIIRLR